MVSLKGREESERDRAGCDRPGDIFLFLGFLGVALPFVAIGFDHGDRPLIKSDRFMKSSVGGLKGFYLAGSELVRLRNRFTVFLFSRGESFKIRDPSFLRGDQGPALFVLVKKKGNCLIGRYGICGYRVSGPCSIRTRCLGIPARGGDNYQPKYQY